MPTWSGILAEIGQHKAEKGVRVFDFVRRKYLAQANAHTKRNVVLYASDFTQPKPQIPSGLLSITDEDLQGLMEVTHGLVGPNLDLIVHSPGGSLEAAEAFVITRSGK